MMNNLNLKYNLYINNIFYKNKYKKYFFLFNEYFEIFINLFLLFIQNENNKLFYIIDLNKKYDSCIYIYLYI